jgi:hypothetical protein
MSHGYTIWHHAVPVCSLDSSHTARDSVSYFQRKTKNRILVLRVNLHSHISGPDFHNRCGTCNLPNRGSSQVEVWHALKLPDLFSLDRTMIELDNNWDTRESHFDQLWDPNNFICESCRQKIKDGQPAICMCYIPERDNRTIF